MKRIFVFALFGITCHVFSQFSINGTIKSESGEALVGANVVIKGLFKGDVTDQNGSYEIENLNAGNYEVVASFIGYQDLSEVVELSGNSILNFSLKPEEIMAEEIIVKGIRAGKDAPVPQTILERKTIQNVYNGEHPVFFIGDLSPSVYTESESGTSFANYGSMRLRGLDQKRINITLNGIPLNDMIDHGVYFSNFTDIANSFESVEIQRGVGTSSNGVASYAGSMNFESINLQKQDAGSVFQLGYGSYNSSRLNVQVNSGMINDKWAFHGSFNRIYSDGYKDNTQTEAYSYFFSGGYFGSKHTFKINAFDARAKNGLGYEAVDLATIKSDPTFNPLNENDVDDFGQQFAQLQHIYKHNKNLYLVNSLYFNGAGGDFPWGYIDSILIQYNYPLTNRHYGIISNIHYSGIENLDLNGGIHAYTFRRNNLEQVSPDFKNPYYDEKSTKDEISAFLRVRYQVNKLSLHGDVQFRNAILNIYPDYNFLALKDDGKLEKTWTFINPKVGLVYYISEGSNIYASVGYMGREPRKVDILGGYGLYDVETYDTLRKGIDFLHESVMDYEVGIKRYTNNYSTSINFFYMNFTNGILESGETIEFGSKVRSNVPESYRTGVEISMNYSPTEKLLFILNGMYMKSGIKEFRFSSDSITTKGLKPILSPETILNGTVNYSVTKNLKLDLSAKYVSESYITLANDEEFTLPSFFLINGRINLKFLKKHTFSLEINNITSAEYYTNGSPVDTNGDWVDDAPGYFVNAPINFFGTFTFCF